MIEEPRCIRELTSLDDWLVQEGIHEEVSTQATKEVIAWQIAEAMKARHLSRARMAELMGTSRSQVARLLDPKNPGVTLDTLQRAAAVVGRRIRLELC
jgi:antitoxin HicB